MSCLSLRRYITKKNSLKYDIMEVLLTQCLSLLFRGASLSWKEAHTLVKSKMKCIASNSKKKSFHQGAKESSNCCTISHKDFNLTSQKMNYSPCTPKEWGTPGAAMKTDSMCLPICPQSLWVLNAYHFKLCFRELYDINLILSTVFPQRSWEM